MLQFCKITKLCASDRTHQSVMDLLESSQKSTEDGEICESIIGGQLLR